MNKLDVQKRVTQRGEPLPLDKFEWNEKAKVFSTTEDNCVIDFTGVDSVTIISGDCSDQKSGRWSTQIAGYESNQTAGHESTQAAGDWSTQTARHWSTQMAGDESTQVAGYKSTQKAGNYSTQTAGSRSNQMAGDESTQEAGSYSTQTAGSFSHQKGKYKSTQTAGHNSTQKAAWFSTQTGGCETTQKAGHYSTQTAGHYSFQTSGGESTHICEGDKITIVNKYTGCLMQGNKGDTIQSCPEGMKGFVVNGMYDGEPHIIADGILSRIVSQKGDVYKVINYGQKKQSWLIKDGDTYSHGETLEEARADLLYKAKDKDTSAYEQYTLDTVVAHGDALKMYRTITGACSSGMRHFVKQNGDKVKNKYTIAELIELTDGAYGSYSFKQFFVKTN